MTGDGQAPPALAAGEGHRGRGPWAHLPGPWTSPHRCGTRKRLRGPTAPNGRRPPASLRGKGDLARPCGQAASRGPPSNPALCAPGASSAPGCSEPETNLRKQGSSHQFPSSNPVRWCPVRSLMTKRLLTDPAVLPATPSSTYKRSLPPTTGELEFQRPHAHERAQRLPLSHFKSNHHCLHGACNPLCLECPPPFQS